MGVEKVGFEFLLTSRLTGSSDRLTSGRLRSLTHSPENACLFILDFFVCVCSFVFFVGHSHNI